ncbi:MAG TPA: extracellular solute-binding protein [Acidimicrobiales bacterium]|nr:extracellular solute-binding protein [Acidimicrobiales bacterium]
MNHKATQESDAIAPSVGSRPNWSKRHRGRRTAMAIATAAVVGATGLGVPTAASASVVHVTWWTMWSGATLKLLNQMTAQFNKTHPGIVVTETNIPSSSTTSTAKLLSSIAAGDPPDIFTEWWPEIGSFAANGDLVSLNQFLTGPYAGFEKWEYPVAVQGGTYKGNLYAIPMGLNSWALYYNTSLLAKYGITSPPKTLAQLNADQAKMWVISNGKVQQVGFYPYLNENGFQFYTSFFNATNCFNSAGKYAFENCAGAKTLMNWIAGYDTYPYTQVLALQTALGQVAGGQTDIWINGKAGFVLSGPWEGAQEVPVSNPKLAGHFGVEAFPGTVPIPSTIGQGNFNIIPKGSAHPAQAFEFMTWLAGYQNETFMGTIDPVGGWVPGGPSVTKAPAYQAWLKANPWLSGFLPEMTSPYTQAPALTPTQAELFNAENTATADVLQKIMTPAQALKYIDQQANAPS